MSMLISRAPSCDCSVMRSAAIYILVTKMRKLTQETRLGNIFQVNESNLGIESRRVDVTLHSKDNRVSGHDENTDLR
jgi:hypothetical protein